MDKQCRQPVASPFFSFGRAIFVAVLRMVYVYKDAVRLVTKKKKKKLTLNCAVDVQCIVHI